MKTKIKPILLTLSFTLLAGSLSAIGLFNKDESYEMTSASPTYSSSLPTTIYLNDNSESDIRNYYSGLNNLAIAQRSGTNLLKNLRTIIHEDITYYPYGSINSTGVTIIYTITDRDWVNSPATSVVGGTYNSNTNTITNYSHINEKNNNPYIKMLYIDYEHSGPTRFLYNSEASFDKEHVWSQSHGFKAASGATGPAGTDLHHLIAGEKTVNQDYHSNWSYGEVAVADKEATIDTVPSKSGDNSWRITGNKLGTSKKTNANDEINKVFEPNDADKGRIARALLYMVACYNNYSGNETITQFDPNLELVDYIINGGTSVGSSSEESAKYGILSTLLKWNHDFPPDEFEIHRNNLIYNNYQHNRNPFIDFPEWADYVWGNEESGYVSTGYASPSTDVLNEFPSLVPVTGVSLDEDSLNLEVGDSETLTATISPNNATNTNVTWSTSNGGVATVNNGVVTAVAAGNATITVTTEDGSFTDTCSVTVTQPVTSVSLNTNSLELEVGGTSQLNATVLPNNASNKNVTWESSNTNVATVSNTGLVTAVATGNATITVTTVSGGKTATCTVTVTESSGVKPGDAVLYSGTLTEGDYVLYYSGKAMKNTVSSNRFEYSDVTPSDDVIPAPASNIVWHIAQSGDYWTLYNEAVGKYAGSTSSKNQGALLESISDNAKWTVTGNSTYEFVNLARSTGSDPNNKYLRNNGTFGFACYAQSTGAALSLYKVVESASPTSITATVNKNFYVGETITKSDITVKDNLGNTINDFEFANYQFTYSDSKPSGEPENKHFNISYNEMNADLSVDVYRESPYEVETLSKYNSDFSFVTATSAGEASNFSGEVNGITYHADNCYRYNDNLSFVTEGSNKEYTTASSFYNSDPYSKAILEVYVSSSMNNYLIEYSENGTNWSAVNSGDAHYFKISYVETVTGFINIYYIDVSFMGDSNSETLSNYVMYEDTENQCLSKLDVAINIFENMTSGERSTFMTSEDYVISTARTRFNAWLTNQGKNVSYQNSDYVVNSSTIGVNILDADNNIVLLLVVLSACTFISCFSVIMYKRRSRRD